jgi:predicted RNA-binding protein with RPS1 domain
MPRKSADKSKQDNNALSPQTETKSEENIFDEPGILAADSNETPESQTDINTQGNINCATRDLTEGEENPANSQTETDSSVVYENTSGLQEDLSQNLSDYQTDIKTSKKRSGSAAKKEEKPDTSSKSNTDSDPGAISSVQSADISQIYHTEYENESQAAESIIKEPKAPRKRVFPSIFKAKPEHQPQSKDNAESLSQSGDKEDSSYQTEPDKTVSRRRRAPVSPVLTIDDERTVETDDDKLRNDLLDLVESQKSKKILSGAIQGVERSAGNPNISFAVIYHGAFKVIIPADETVEPPNDFRDRSPADVMHYLVTKRLGAEVDYVIKGIDPNTGVAAASRLEAMALKRRQYYFGTDRDGNNLIYEGLSAEARIVSVIRAGVFVDLFGLETYISLRELSYQRWIDAAAHFQSGQRVLVKILKLDRSDRDNIRVTASVKQAGENPYEQALKRYNPGSRYVGTVSMVDTTGVFVSLEGGVDCLCSYPKRGRPPRGARVTVRVIGINHENNRIWGAITHMTTAR